MKFAISIALLLGIASVGLSRADRPPADEIRFSAFNISKEGHLTTLRGQVLIETTSVTIRADEAVVDTQTMEVQPSGNVHLTLKK
jgi:lipopolysaccharide assembly outer membrane protein LptD (OstA)